MNRAIWAYLAAVVVSLAAPLSAQSTQRVPPRIAVADFTVTGIGEPRYWLGYVYAEVLARRLGQCGGLMLIEPVELRQRQASVAATDLDSLGRQCVDAGRAANAAWVISGQIEDKGATLVVTPLVASVEKGQFWTPNFAEVPLEKMYDPQVEIIVEKYLKELGVRGMTREEAAAMAAYDPRLALDVAELLGEGWRAWSPEAPEKAMDLWRQAVLRDPECYLAEEAIALASYQYRRVLLERSQQLYEKLVAQEPNNAYAHYRLAEVLRDQDDLQRAAEEYNAALGLRWAFIEARLGLGLVLIQMGRNEQAMTEFQRVLEQDPKHYKALHNLAVATYRNGKTQDARAVWERIIELYPGDPVAQRALERYYRAPEDLSGSGAGSGLAEPQVPGRE